MFLTEVVEQFDGDLDEVVVGFELLCSYTNGFV